MKEILKVFVAVFAVMTATSPAYSESTSSVTHEDYGIKLTLPGRWTLQKKGMKVGKAEHLFQLLLQASDVKGYADVMVFVRKAPNGDTTLSRQEQTEILNRLAIHKYSPGTANKYDVKENEATALRTGSGETADSRSLTLTYTHRREGNFNRQVILAAIPHKNRFFCIAVFNTSVDTDIKGLAADTILAGAELF